MNETTLLGMSVLMFIGAGPASTSGGIKVTTAAVLVAVIWSEVRGERDVNVFRRRLPTADGPPIADDRPALAGLRRS